jgi:ribosomal protein S18 acetylase RimI-like enzyme
MTQRKSYCTRNFLNSVTLQISEVNDHEVRINLIETYTTLRNRGWATKALEFLCELADRHGVTMNLQPSPQLDLGCPLSIAQLVTWYQRFGFIYLKSGDMQRLPR